MSDSDQVGGARSHLRRYVRLAVLSALGAAAFGTIAASGPGVEAQSTGEATYQQNCAACHGPEGEGGVGPALGGVDEHGIEYVRQAIREGRPPLMPAWEGVLTPQQINAVADYVAAFEGDGHDHGHDTTTTTEHQHETTTTTQATTTTTQATTTTTQATTTTTQGTTTTTQATTTSQPGGGGDCVTASNSQHRDAGRADGFLILTAVGSGDSLGLWLSTTSLEQTSPGSWSLVDGCEGDPAECGLIDWLLGQCDPSGNECSLIDMLFGRC